MFKPPLVATGAALGLAAYAGWVFFQTNGIYTGFSIQRIRFAHLSPTQRHKQMCLGARAIKDALNGNVRSDCIFSLRKAGIPISRQGLTTR